MTASQDRVADRLHDGLRHYTPKYSVVEVALQQARGGDDQ